MNGPRKKFGYVYLNARTGESMAWSLIRYRGLAATVVVRRASYLDLVRKGPPHAQ